MKTFLKDATILLVFDHLKSEKNHSEKCFQFITKHRGKVLSSIMALNSDLYDFFSPSH